MDRAELEEKILSLLIQDFRIKEIAVELNRSDSRIELALSELREKWEVRTNHGLIAKYLKSEL